MITSQNMPEQLLTRQQLTILNKKSLRYPLIVAEKDYFLALAIKQISHSGLNQKLIFKGGTAIHHCYLDQYRFSEDLDFTSLDENITLEEILSALQKSGLFKASKAHRSENTIKIQKLQYPGVLGQPGNIKIEIDFKQNVILAGKLKRFNNVWGVDATPLVMHPVEICAEKIRAASQRARYRDFYDLYYLISELKVNPKKAVMLLKKKEIRYPVSPEHIKENWTVALEEKSRDLGGIYCFRNLDDSSIERMIASFVFRIINPH